ncbi:MAG TPA: hypothetical protein DIT04_10145 [Dysgonomonas sp.]|nr:hypothetical protein [Dysgonomonas sp.]
MKYFCLSVLLFSLFSYTGYTQEVQITETASLEQVYGESTESESLLPFNDLDIEFGYVLYQTELEIESPEAVLEIENVRDYAVIYIDDKLQGTVSDNNKKLTLNTVPGKYTLKIYTENIGRITYGPEILDNSKGLFGNINLEGRDIENWTIIPLHIKDCDINELQFEEMNSYTQLPSFYKGYFNIGTTQDTYLDISGWGMGEVWINGNYVGSFWEEEKQQSIQIPADNLIKGKNEVVIFELKNNKRTSVRLSETPVFK